MLFPYYLTFNLINFLVCRCKYLYKLTYKCSFILIIHDRCLPRTELQLLYYDFASFNNRTDMYSENHNEDSESWIFMKKLIFSINQTIK